MAILLANERKGAGSRLPALGVSGARLGCRLSLTSVLSRVEALGLDEVLYGRDIYWSECIGEADTL